MEGNTAREEGWTKFPEGNNSRLDGGILQFFVAMRRPRKPKYLDSSPTGKQPSIAEDVDALENKLFQWRAISKYVDYEEEEWGWENVDIKQFFNKCLPRLQHYEGKTWAQIKEADHCHPVPLKDIVPRAQQRITSRHSDMDNLWQVKADGRCRLFGRKDRQIFYLIWHDKNHTVYPSGR